VSHASAFVWVVLGDHHPATLPNYTELVSRVFPDADLFLVTDNPKRWLSLFPGTVIRYHHRDRAPAVKWIERQFPGKALASSGFWLKTVERIFALEAVAGFVSPQQEIIHLEADVASLLTEAQLSALRLRCAKIGVPATSATAGCASLLYARDISILSRGLQSLSELYIAQGRWVSDMGILSIAISEGVFEELPTLPEDAWHYECLLHQPPCAQKLVFDASALGMYLIGLDPVHTGGALQSGYIQEDYRSDLLEFRWSIEPECERFAQAPPVLVVSRREGVKFNVANLHIHAKIPLVPLEPGSRFWSTVLSEANREQARERRNYDFDSQDKRLARLSIRTPVRLKTVSIWARLIAVKLLELFQRKPPLQRKI
jgi:hypothetical protein